MLPRARGSATEELFAHLQQQCRALPRQPEPDDAEDAALALYVLYELHYRGFAAVDERWEWEPSVLRCRRALEEEFEHDLRTTVGRIDVAPCRVVEELQAIATKDGPSLSGWLEARGTRDQMREYAVHRSAYQLKEADPYTWAVPRLYGAEKAALVEIQHGEYGDGRADALHSALFADTMRALELDPTYGAYIDRIPAVTLETVNLMSLFGLHRRLRGALVGHLTLFEMCSVGPMRRYAFTLRRLGVPAAAPFYDVHVDADDRHAAIALYDMARGLAHDEPDLANDIIFGAHALDAVESAFARHLLESWQAGCSSLRPC